MRAYRPEELGIVVAPKPRQEERSLVSKLQRLKDTVREKARYKFLYENEYREVQSAINNLMRLCDDKDVVSKLEIETLINVNRRSSPAKSNGVNKFMID